MTKIFSPVNLIFLLWTIPVCSTAAADLTAPPPEQIYLSYLKDLQQITSLDDARIEKYLSLKARKLRTEAFDKKPATMSCSPCPTPEQALNLYKKMRPYPKPGARPKVKAGQEFTTLTYSWQETAAASDGSNPTPWTMHVVVELVNEQGWKLKSESWEMLNQADEQKPKDGTGFRLIKDKTTLSHGQAWNY